MKIRSTQEQPKNRLFSMCMVFSLHLELTCLNRLAQSCGFQEQTILENAVEVRIRQTVPFIPDRETIRKYENHVRESYVSEEFSCTRAAFKGYDWFYEVQPKTKERGETETEEPYEPDEKRT